MSEVALGRYQNIMGQQHMVCEAGTLLFPVAMAFGTDGGRNWF